MSAPHNDHRHMAQALGLAARGLGRTWPNPAVGCVIVDAAGHVVGRGITQPGGRPHAEVAALAQAGAFARGASAYVTLEPCSHHGKTPPCAEALIAAGVARVVFAATDPDPRVNGRGHARLRAAGIEVRTQVMEAEATQLNAGFFKRVTRGLPLLTLKMAATLDGRIATSSGESRWISGHGARRYVHMLRLCHDAVLVGSGTAVADDPDLTIRDMGEAHQPLRIVLDGGLQLGTHSRLALSAQTHPVWMLHHQGADKARRAAWQRTGARLFEVRSKDGHIDPEDALRTIAAQGVTRILCEGGGQLAGALCRDSLVDELIHITAGKLIGREGAPVVGDLSLAHLADAPQFKRLEARAIGEDYMARFQAIHR